MEGCYNGKMANYKKDFDEWNERKKVTDSKESSLFFKERDIWWVAIGINVGFEEDGKGKNFVRPVLVVKKFNKEMFLGVPLSTKLKDNKYYVKITVKEDIVSAMISQLRVFSSKRIWNKLVELDEKDFEKVVEEVSKFFILPPSRK